LLGFPQAKMLGPFITRLEEISEKASARERSQNLGNSNETVLSAGGYSAAGLRTRS
jgi:hypothetical protein